MEAVLRVKNLNKSFGSRPVIRDVSFDVYSGEIFGFLGPNGAGKTTTIKMILGFLFPDSGEISICDLDLKKHYEKAMNLVGGIVENPELYKEMTGYENLRMYARLHDGVTEERIQEVVRLVGMQNRAGEKLKKYSLGMKQRIGLAQAIVHRPRLLILDEPTNHLDMKARETVSAYLKRKKGFILVSHDRCFLDGCVDHILSINRSNIEVQSGNFSSWMENFERQQEFELAQNVKLKKSIDNLQKAAQRTSVWSDRIEASKYGNGPVDRGYIGHKSAKMMKRSKSIEVRQQRAIEEKSGLLKNLEIIEDLKITPLLYFSDTLVTFSDVVPIFDGKDVCQPISFTVKRGERIALDGKNGSGKTSILKLLIGQQIEHRGTVTIGSGMILSYVPQDTSMLNGSLSEFAEANRIDESLFKAILREMDFSRIQFEKKMEDFSAGQKKKVLIAKSLCEQAHLYVWDEPLNYIDIYSRMQIENLIREFSPTMIFVEHDLAFRNTIATKTVYIESTPGQSCQWSR